MVPKQYTLSWDPSPSRRTLTLHPGFPLPTNPVKCAHVPSHCCGVQLDVWIT